MMLYYIQIHQLSEILSIYMPMYTDFLFDWQWHDHDVDWCLLMLIDALWFWLVLNWCWLMLMDVDWCLIDANWCSLMLIDALWCWFMGAQFGQRSAAKKLKSVISRFCKVNIQQSFTWYLLFHIEILEAKTPIGWLNFWTSLFHFLDTIASPRSYPCQSVGEWVINSFRFGDSYRISELCELVLLQ